jgi:hypothetical protein
MGTPDDCEVLKLLKMIVKEEISIIILLLAPQDDIIEAFSHRNNVSVIKAPSSVNVAQGVINKLKLLGTKDLIVMGYKTYGLEEGEHSISAFVDYHSCSSFLLVRCFRFEET